MCECKKAVEATEKPRMGQTAGDKVIIRAFFGGLIGIGVWLAFCGLVAMLSN